VGVVAGLAVAIVLAAVIGLFSLRVRLGGSLAVEQAVVYRQGVGSNATFPAD
jgi:hypothetical protein